MRPKTIKAECEEDKATGERKKRDRHIEKSHESSLQPAMLLIKATGH